MNDMTLDEIFSLVGTKSNSSKHLAKRIWNNMVSLIISEMQNNSYIRIENFGKFEIIQTGGRDEWVENEFGAMEKKWVDFDISVKFTPSKNLIEAIKNGSSKNWFKKKCEDDLVIQKNINDFDERTRLEICEDMKDKAILLANRRKRYTSEKVEGLPNAWTIELYCKENNIHYESIRKCSQDLNIGYMTVMRAYKKARENNYKSFELRGYNFDLIEKEII